MIKDFHGPELVMGGFRSVRFFRLNSLDQLRSVAFRHVIYTDPEMIYEARCEESDSVVARKLSRNFLSGIIQYPENAVFRYSLECVLVGDDILVPLYTTGEIAETTHPSLLRGNETTWLRLPKKFYQEAINHEAPFSDLSCCGFYSFYVSEEQPLSAVTKMSGCDQAEIVAVVENYGRVIHGTKGLRSQKMKILGIAPNPHHWATFTPTPKKFEDHHYGSYDDLIAKFPPSCVEGLFDGL